MNGSGLNNQGKSARCIQETNGVKTMTEAMMKQSISLYGMFDRIMTTRSTGAPIRPDYTITQSISMMMKEPEWHECDLCGGYHTELFVTFADGYVICDDCRKENCKICGDCGSVYVFDGDQARAHKCVNILKDTSTGKTQFGFVCKNCISYYKTCSVCGAWHDERILKERESRNMCPACRAEYDSLRSTCTRCGKLHKKELLFNGLCKECFTASMQQSLPQKPIGGYHKTEGTVFLSTSSGVHEYLGTELEVTYGNECPELRKAMFEFKEVELKRDGSVPGGIEIVSYPLSLDYHKNIMGWKKMFAILEKHGYKSHDTSNCGYHIHISRSAFGDTPRKQSKNIAGFLYLFQKFRREMEIFSRRVNYSYCKFYSLDYADLTITRAYQKACNYNAGSRYMVLNFQNDHTVECRLFRGTLNYTTYIAALDLMSHFAMLATTKDETELRSMSWSNVVGAIVCKPHLIDYLKKRKIMG